MILCKKTACSDAPSLVCVFVHVGAIFVLPEPQQCASLAFLAQQCRRRLRSEVSSDDPRAAGDIPFSTLHKPSTTTNPFAFGGPGNDANAEIGPNSWQRKLIAWRNGFCASGAGESGSAKTARVSLPPPAPLALFLRLRTPTEAFRLLAAAEECSPRPLSATVSATFVSAAEGLHGALSMEAAAAWRHAVCPDAEGGGTEVGFAGRTMTDDLLGSAGGTTVPEQSSIEPILAGLANCWRLQRVSARCASLIGRLLLETAVSIAKQGTGRAGDAAATGLAYTRACSWLLASGEPVQESLARLQGVAARVSAVGDDMERKLSAAPSFVFVSDGDGDEEDNGGDEEDSSLTTAGESSPNLEEVLPRAMYESYLLPSLGVGHAPAGRAPPISVRDGEPLPLDDALTGLVSYLHIQDMRQLSQRPGLRGLVDGVPRSTPLSTAVVRGSRIPWAACPTALSQALVALDEQDKALAECNSSNISTSSGSSGTSLSGRKTPPGVTNRSKPATKPRRGAGLSRASSISPLDIHHSPGGDGSSLLPAQEWVAVARAILLGYSEIVENGSIGSASPALPTAQPARTSILTVHPRVLQLACERHPALVVASSVRVGAGPLARDLLAGGQAQPVVAALVNLTSCDTYTGRSGTMPHLVKSASPVRRSALSRETSLPTAVDKSDVSSFDKK